MMLAENKVCLALERGGDVVGAPQWLREALMIDQMAQRYGWSFVSEGLGIKELDMETLGVLQGILNGEAKKEKRDRMRQKLRS